MKLTLLTIAGLSVIVTIVIFTRPDQQGSLASSLPADPNVALPARPLQTQSSLYQPQFNGTSAVSDHGQLTPEERRKQYLLTHLYGGVSGKDSNWEVSQQLSKLKPTKRHKKK